MPDQAPEPSPDQPSLTEEVDDAIAEELDPDTQADELLVEQIEEAQDSATLPTAVRGLGPPGGLVDHLPRRPRGPHH
jgi:hypothetical protein